MVDLVAMVYMYSAQSLWGEFFRGMDLGLVAPILFKIGVLNNTTGYLSVAGQSEKVRICCHLMPSWVGGCGLA